MYLTCWHLATILRHDADHTSNDARWHVFPPSRLPLLGCPEKIRLPPKRLNKRISHSAQGPSHLLGVLFMSWPCQVSARESL